ncbi:MAG: sugar ABC transporter ATP-binding protein [Paracoccaceae bacterium]
MAEPLLEIRGLTKHFGGIAALSNGNFRLMPGTVHALCGGNGAGKSTLLTIVMGIQDRDGGTILLGGREVDFASPSQARRAGITIIEQELSPIPAMTVAENIYLGREPLALFGRVDFATMNRNAQDLLDSLEFDITPTTMMMDLTVAEIQLVEIAKALSFEAEVIIMDEPTSALGGHEVERLFTAIRRLKEAGKGIIYVSHRLSEIFDVADSYTVFRDGAFVAEGQIADVTREEMIQMIVGRPLTEEFVKENTPINEVALAVRNLNAEDWVKDITFDVHRGEILVLYGLMGSGRSEIFERIWGLSEDRGGEVMLFGQPAGIRRPADAIERGIAFVTEDRKGTGLVLTSDVRFNLCLAQLDKLRIGPVMMKRREAEAAGRMIEAFSIKTPTDRLEVSGLSGGNQQRSFSGAGS